MITTFDSQNAFLARSHKQNISRGRQRLMSTILLALAYTKIVKLVSVVSIPSIHIRISHSLIWPWNISTKEIRFSLCNIKPKDHIANIGWPKQSSFVHKLDTTNKCSPNTVPSFHSTFFLIDVKVARQKIFCYDTRNVSFSWWRLLLVLHFIVIQKGT